MPPSTGRRDSSAGTFSISLVPFDDEDLAGGEEQHRLGEAVAEDVQQHRGDRKRASRRGAEGDEAHVLDAVVGEHPLVVALGEQQRRGDERATRARR